RQARIFRSISSNGVSGFTEASYLGMNYPNLCQIGQRLQITARLALISFHPMSSPAEPLSGLFTRHPATVGETYAEHLATASGFGGRMIVAGLACLVHGLLPFLFQRTGSAAIAALHDRMVVNRRRQAAVPESLSAGRPAGSSCR